MEFKKDNTVNKLLITSIGLVCPKRQISLIGTGVAALVLI